MNNRVSPEPFDTLDYLEPSVKKEYSAYNKHLKPADRLLRDFRRNIFLKSSPCSSTELDVQTCSSLLLKNSTKQLIQDQYSIFNVTKYNSISNLCCKNKTQHKKSHLNKERPIIKVTVIPKIEENNTEKIFNKRCKKSGKIQTTISNHENFFKNQNSYCFIKGTKREKVHELKNSGSYNLSSRDVNDRHGNILLRKISESKQLLDSLNMDKKKRRERKVKNKKRVLISENFNCEKELFDDKISNVDGRRSRVTVVGQLGLNNENRYVLKCAATMNDKPIATNIITSDFDEDFTRFNRGYNLNQSRYTNSKIGCYIDNCENLRTHRQQDSYIQTDFVYPYSSNAATTKGNRVASQGTQVNLNFSNQIPSQNFLNQTAQCYCTRSTIANTFESEVGDNVLKECKSPLVIISVYPRPDNANDKETVKIIRHTSPEKKELTNSMRNSNIQEKFREPSPVKVVKSKLTKMESKLTRSRSSSPKPRKEFINKSETAERKYNSFKKGNSHQVRSPKSNVINNLQKPSACQCNTKSLETEGLNQKEIKTMLSKSRNTEQVKKALVNSFLRNMQAMDRNNKNSKQLPPKDETSKVTINIEGEKEHYNVLLENSNYDSGVFIKKTIKPSQKDSNEADLMSLENVLMYSDDDVNNEYSYKIRRTQPSYDDTKVKPDSRLNIRDSIEICRRQGKHSNHTFKPFARNDKNSTEISLNTDFSAPIKHYPGDNCSISDPNERDREIRELLGVIRNQRKQVKQNMKATCVCNDEGCCCIQSSNGMMTESSNKQINKHFKSKNKKEKQSKIIDTEPFYLKYEKKDNVALSQKHQSESKVIPKKVIPKKDHDHISKIQDMNVSLLSKFPPKIIEETFQKDEYSKDNVPAIEKFGLLNDKNALKRVSKVDTDIQLQKVNSLSPSLIVNRNIQIFLQVEQLNRNKPVLLNKKQYEKVKKIIERKISKKFSIDKRKLSSLKNCNVISVGEIKVKKKIALPLHIDHEVQTDRLEIKTQENCKPHKNKKENILHVNKDVSVHEEKDRIREDCAEPEEKDNISQISPRQAVSSVEIRYTKMKYKKCITVSSSSTRFTNNGMPPVHTNSVKRVDSILTIFKGHKKSATPNLGASCCSLYSDRTNFSYKSHKQPQCAGDFKAKKPFLQRLISCIVMRSNDLSNRKDVVPKKTIPTHNSTDSYHLSTSLGVLEMSSSFYDTSASFYSNHTILPVNKIKKGFFRSVRELLRRN